MTRASQSRAFVDEWLARALPPREAHPRRLHAAMTAAVFPGGQRARPILCRLVTEQYDGGDEELSGRLCAAIELVHCASLVQDDLPCFDDAATRRGEPACHVEHGPAAAILVGDALLALAFATIARAPAGRAGVAVRLIDALGDAVGTSRGVIGGQALELEDDVDTEVYHRQKTAALFRLAALGGAIVRDADERDIDRWARVGELVGCALQLRDDLDDLDASPLMLGKPTGRDRALGRPNAAIRIGVEACEKRRVELVAEAHALVGCGGARRQTLRRWIDEVAHGHRREQVGCVGTSSGGRA
jgi:geranylgeranyl diphosphate synthase, type II